MIIVLGFCLIVRAFIKVMMAIIQIRMTVSIVVIIIIALTAIGGGTYVYIHKNNSETTAVQNEIVENTKELENEITTTKVSSSPTKTEAKTTVTAKVITESVPKVILRGKNCGGISDLHLLVESDKRTAEEIESLGCFSDAILNCSSAFLNLTGEDASTYQVFNKNGQNCVIGTTFGGNVKCDMPLSVISDLEKYSIEEKEPIENLIVPVSFIIGFKEAKNIKTGEAIKITCQNY